ncbi:MAG: translational GTPase TypA [Pseudomonadota bacterium]
MSPDLIRNIAIVAHVDHGKTTLVDELLSQSGTLDQRRQRETRVMDNNDLERERGITILAKNTAIDWQGHRINLVDTPGHADFGGEVERILSMVDAVLLLVDAVEGPMPQTRFVTQKAFAKGLNPIVVINKMDRDGARPDWVLNETFDLFDRLDATEEQLDFPVVYCSAINGQASLNAAVLDTNMDSLFSAIINGVAPPQCEVSAPLQMQISALDYSSYVGTIGIGRIRAGEIRPNQGVTIVNAAGETRGARVLEVLGFRGLEREKLERAGAGDIVALTGIDGVQISDTLCAPERVEALAPLVVDEPTVSVTFEVSDSPLIGGEAQYVTSRQILERLENELEYNVALRVQPTADPKCIKVSGRGELHLSVLIENMRREGFGFCVGRPQVVEKIVDGQRQEPFEQLVVELASEYQGAVMERLGERRGELQDMRPDGRGRVRLEYDIPARGIIGFRTEFLTLSSGTGVMYHTFDSFRGIDKKTIGSRNNGVLIANGNGRSLAYALFNLQERGRLLVGPGETLYEGMIIGIHNRPNDLVVNPMKAKQLTNIRASGNDENVLLTPPVKFDLEQALEFIGDDELVEVSPTMIRLRKRQRSEIDRKREQRAKGAA